ncbi:MAG: hypothetical protein AAF192_15280, partial [Pseudomonadota bacterium]
CTEGSTMPSVHLPALSLGEAVVEDYVAMRLSLRAHPVELLRPLLTPGFDGPDAAAPAPSVAAAPDGAS